MKNFYYLFTILLFFNWNINAQFQDNMEWQAANCPGHWGGICPIISTDYARSGSQSGLIPGDGVTDNILDLGNKIFGEWSLEFWVYIPAGQRGYYNVQGTIPVGGGEWAIGNIFFNDGDGNNGPGTGYIDFSSNAAADWVYFNYPEGEWFRIIMNVDISLGIGAATFSYYVDDVEIIPSGTPFADANGVYPTSLGGLDFWSNSQENEMYIDDFCYSDWGNCSIVGVEDFSKIDFTIYPNPSQNLLNIDTQVTIISLRIYNVLGHIVKETVGLKSIDISNLASGIYFIEVSTDTGKSIRKFIKE